MEKYGQIPLIKEGVVFSDPSYDETVWCQYRKEFTAVDWFVKMKTESKDGFISIQMLLGRPTALASIMTQDTPEGLQITFPARYEVRDVEIGMDSASMFCGYQGELGRFC